MHLFCRLSQYPATQRDAQITTIYPLSLILFIIYLYFFLSVQTHPTFKFVLDAISIRPQAKSVAEYCPIAGNESSFLLSH